MLINNTQTGSTLPAFLAPANYATSGTNPSGVAVGDLNRDGLPDIAVANAGNSQVQVFFNQAVSPGTFANGGTVAAEPRGIVVMDVNGDGQADVTTSNGTGQCVSALRNRTLP